MRVLRDYLQYSGTGHFLSANLQKIHPPSELILALHPSQMYIGTQADVGISIFCLWEHLGHVNVASIG